MTLRTNVQTLPPKVPLGGSANPNLLVTGGRSLRVARVYRPFVTGRRIAALRRSAATSPARHPVRRAHPGTSGRGSQTFQGRAVEVEPYVAAPAAMNTLPGCEQA